MKINKHITSVFNATYYISAYDGDTGTNIFSTLEKAIAFCHEEEEIFVENPLKQGSGWLISEHIVDQPREVIFYNAKGQKITHP